MRALPVSAAELSTTPACFRSFRGASSYTGLPPQYLSFNSRRTRLVLTQSVRLETRLVKLCEIKGEMFGKAMVQVMQLARA